MADPLDATRFRQVQGFSHPRVDPSSQIAEEYRMLRSRLEAMQLRAPSLLLTSCHHDEGKTSTAIQLALCMARRTEARILLADFDLRRPRLRRVLGLPPCAGDVLAALKGECAPEEAILYSPGDNLHVLPARSDCASSADLLEAKSIRALMDRLHASFDFVIVDCSPCLSTPDAVVLCPHVGSVALVVRSLRTQRGSIEHAVNDLRDLNVPVAGVILTHVRYFFPSYLYRYQYGGADARSPRNGAAADAADVFPALASARGGGAQQPVSDETALV